MALVVPLGPDTSKDAFCLLPIFFHVHVLQQPHKNWNVTVTHTEWYIFLKKINKNTPGCHKYLLQECANTHSVLINLNVFRNDLQHITDSLKISISISICYTILKQTLCICDCMYKKIYIFSYQYQNQLPKLTVNG